LEFGVGRDAALGNFADGFGFEGDGIVGGEIERIGKAVENVFALADGVDAFAPVGGAAAAEEDEGGFFAAGGGGIGFPGIEAPGGHAHPFPLDAFAGEVEEFAGLAFGERARVNDVWKSSHGVLQPVPGIFRENLAAESGQRGSARSKRFAAGRDETRKHLGSPSKGAEFRGWATR